MPEIKGQDPYYTPWSGSDVIPVLSRTPNSGDILTGTPTQPGSGAYGGVPTVPSPGTTSVDALLANINNLGLIGQLGSTLTQQGSANAMQPLTASLPGLSGDLGSLMSNFGAMSRGEIAPDVLSVLQQQAAERGVGTGQGVSSPNTNAAYLKAVYDTSTNNVMRGLGGITSLMGAIPKGPTFDPSTMLLSPQMQQMWQYLANVLKAAPNPEAAANTNTAALLSGLGRGRGNTGGGYNPAQAALDFVRSLIRPDTPPRDIPAGFPDPSKGSATVPGYVPGEDMFDTADRTGGIVIDPASGVAYDPQTGLMIPPEGYDMGDSSSYTGPGY